MAATEISFSPTNIVVFKRLEPAENEASYLLSSKSGKDAEQPSQEMKHLEEAFTTECNQLIFSFGLGATSYERIRKLIDLLNSKADLLDAQRCHLDVQEVDSGSPTIKDIRAPPTSQPVERSLELDVPMSELNISTMSYRFESDITGLPVPVDPLLHGMKGYKVPNYLPERPFYLPILGERGGRISYYGYRDGMERYPMCCFSAFQTPSHTLPAGSGRGLRFAELQTRYVLEQNTFNAIWDSWGKGPRISDWCDDVERHRGPGPFPDPNEAIMGEDIESNSCIWWEELDHARMEALDRARTPAQRATGPPVLIRDELSRGLTEVSDQVKPISGGNPAICSYEIQTHLDQFMERLERRMEQLAEEVKLTVAAQIMRGAPDFTKSTGSLTNKESVSAQAQTSDTKAAQKPLVLARSLEASVCGSSKTDSGLKKPVMTEQDGGSCYLLSESVPARKLGTYEWSLPVITVWNAHSDNQSRVSSDLVKEWVPRTRSEGADLCSFPGELERVRSLELPGIHTIPQCVSIIDNYDDGHLDLDFQPLTPTAIQRSRPLKIPPRRLGLFRGPRSIATTS